MNTVPIMTVNNNTYYAIRRGLLYHVLSDIISVLNDINIVAWNNIQSMMYLNVILRDNIR